VWKGNESVTSRTLKCTHMYVKLYGCNILGSL
jgi:hypothetical protein